MKLKTLKTMGIPIKINVILLNIKINRPKLVDMCKCEFIASYTLHTCDP